VIGQRIQHYEIRERLGAGGMGEVWRASDSKLGRDVALKVLPQSLIGDPERLARFQREAQVLASLNHPNIGAIYGLEESDGVRCLVLELVRGETLSERITRGALPLDEALSIARQIADAMEYAHDRGVMHRDLKPGNVMLTPDGTVKVLDFGLAKAFDSPAGPQQDLSMSPTLTLGATVAGVILGTAGYMSPEQAKGKQVDRRADIWAFGIVLFEMLSGRQAFTGETVSEVLAAVMMREIDWSQLPDGVPAPVERLLRRCLEKDPRRRLRDIGEARLALEDFIANPAAATAAASPAATAPAAAPARSRWLPWAVAGALAVLAVLAVWAPWRPAPPAPRVVELDVELSPEPLFSGYGAAAVLSRQGDRIAFSNEGDERQLYVRDLNDPAPRVISGTTLAYHQFFSPDGDWIGFFTRTELKKVSVRGGSPLTLAQVALNRGGTWGEDDTIIYAPDPGSGLMRIPASGGTPQAFTVLDSTAGEVSHRWPSWIHGHDAVLFTVFSSAPGLEQGRIEIADTKTGARKVLHVGGTYPRYVDTGHILYVHQGTFFALPFDVDKREVKGVPGPVAEDVRFSQAEGGAQYDVSDDGTMIGVFGQGSGAELAELVRMGFDGSTEVIEPSAEIGNPAVSPDGRRVAATVGTFGNADVWVYDLARGTRTRMTFAEDVADWHPVWSPDGATLAFSSNRDRPSPVTHLKASDGSGEAKRISESAAIEVPSSWNPNGKGLLFYTQVSGSWNLGYRDLEAKEPVMLTDTRAVKSQPQFSPDGRWIAYNSNESGRMEVYVQPYPGPGGKWQISTRGGTEARWSRRGDALFYRWDGTLYSVPITLRAGSVEAGVPVERLKNTGDTSFLGDYDLMPDGRGIVSVRLLRRQQDVGELRRVRLIFHWLERVRSLAPKPER